MGILNRNQIKAWDDYTMLNEPISSIDLMERAAAKVFDWIQLELHDVESFVFFCGKGNNGGDGMAVARMIFEKNIPVIVFLLDQGEMSEDSEKNFLRLAGLGCTIYKINEMAQLEGIRENAMVVDALFGTGLSRPLDGIAAEVVDFINRLPNRVISIDLPSGLPADTLIANNHAVRADYTLSFQRAKFSFFLPEHALFTGKWVLLDIGLHPKFEETVFTPYQFCEQAFIKQLLPAERTTFSHKGNYGHAVLFGGSPGMMGALIMALKACLKSGVGLLTANSPDDQISIVQSSVPEAMCGPFSSWNQHSWYESKTAVGVGMGWREDDFHGKLLQWLISNVSAPLLIDAGALNLLASNLNWLFLRPPNAVTILTPHPGEFSRLAGKASNSLNQLEKAKEMASTYKVIVILKGAYTRIITPHGLVYFNSTGNPGMAKGGSGDILSGLVTGLIAQGMATVSACLLGVYLHGLAGDLAEMENTQWGMTATDIIHQLPMAWKKIMD